MFHFSDNDHAIMKQKYEKEKLSATSIGKLFGASGPTIIKELKKLGVNVSKKVSITDEQQEEFKRLHNEGMYERDLASHFSIDRIVVRRFIKEFGLKPHINGKIAQDSEKSTQALALYNDGYSTPEIAGIFNLHRNSIQNLLKANNIDITRVLTEKEKKQILELREAGNGTRNIAKILGRERGAIQNYLHSIGIYNIAPPPKPPTPRPTHKICTNCKEEKPIEEFHEVKKTLKDGTKTSLLYPQCNSCYDLRKSVSGSIAGHIKRAVDGTGKQCKKEGSCLDFLPYTILELKQHIESIFQQVGNEWMTWQNWGKYIKERWDDNDQSTWTWQLDHIIPHCTFQYTSMSDSSFQECWALSNLRPISAKQNILDNDKGARMGLFGDDIGNEDYR